MPILKNPSSGSMEFVRSSDILHKFCIKVKQMPVDRTNNCNVSEIMLWYKVNYVLFKVNYVLFKTLRDIWKEKQKVTLNSSLHELVIVKTHL